MFPEITPPEAFAALAAPDAPILIDIRLDEDRVSPARIPAAHDAACDDLATHVALAQGRSAVVICHKGLKLSAGATARLVARGIAARRLRGGFVGWVAAGLPTLDTPRPSRIALPLDASPEDAIAAWATLRFDTPEAELIEVPRADLDGVRARFQATAPRCPFPLAFDADLPTLAALLSVQRPSALFHVLDALFRARHQTFTCNPDASAVSRAEELRP